MCIAILTPKGKRVPNDKLFRCWTINDDGGGFAYVDENDKIVVKKGFDKYSDFQKAYEEAANLYADASPFLVHMRIRSAGDHGMSNTHPFLIEPSQGPRGALIHNGTMFYPVAPYRGEKGDEWSDTRAFATKLGPILAHKYVASGAKLLERAIGSSRMAFLYENREYVILNETGTGNWCDGIWYSNGAHNASTTNYDRQGYTR